MNNEGALDWGAELTESLIWIGWVSATSLIGLLVIGALLIRVTSWGGQFWRVAGGFFTGRSAPVAWTFVVALLLLSITMVRLSVLFTYQGLDLFNSFQAGGAALGMPDGDPGRAAALDAAESAFWKAMGIFAILATIYIARGIIEMWVGGAFQIWMRRWVTEHMTDDWLRDRAFYRNRFVPVEAAEGELTPGVDNPDQRIEGDITTMVASTRQFLFSSGGSTSGGVIPATVSIITFTILLWGLSGPLSFTMPLTGWHVDLSHGLVYLLMMFVFVSSMIAFWLGRPLIRLNFWRERLTANFRFGLVRVRENAEPIALYSGERVEQHNLTGRFDQVIANQWRIIYRTIAFGGWNWSISQISVVLPYLIQAGRFFSGQISLGQLTQTASAFGNLSDALSFFRLIYDDFTVYRASLIRLDGLREANQKARAFTPLTTRDGAADVPARVELSAVRIEKPDGQVLIDDLSLVLAAGETLVVTGPSGAGKTSLFRGLAGLWPFADGDFVRPGGGRTLFLSQSPYLPLGDLRSVLAYPGTADTHPDDLLREVLAAVALPHLTNRLDDDEDWGKVLSPGERQRIAVARVLLNRPQAVFLDEATSSVDEGLEHTLYSLIRSRLPETIVVSISHRPTLQRHHLRVLRILGEDGRWELSDLPVPTS